MTSALKKLKSIQFKQHESVIKEHKPRKLSKIEDFTILEEIGKGTYSTVLKARRNDIRQIYALKQIPLTGLTSRERANALNEVRIMASVNHSSVVGYRDSFVDQPNNMLYIVMDYATDGDLYQKICELKRTKSNLPEDYIWKVFIRTV